MHIQRIQTIVPSYAKQLAFLVSLQLAHLNDLV